METTISVKSHYDTMRDLHLVMDLDKLAKLFQELEDRDLQDIVVNDDYNETKTGMSLPTLQPHNSES